MKNFDMKRIFQMAQDAQKKLEEEMKNIKVEGSSGGEMVKVLMDGKKKVLSVKIDPEIVSNDDIETLEDLVVSAFNSASEKVDEELKNKLGEITGFMNIPGLF